MTTTTATLGTFDIHIITQYRENYGTADQPYWKFKGGDTYVVTGFVHPLADGIGQAGQAVVNHVREQIEYANDYAEQYLIDWSFQPVGTLTDDERLELEYDGAVRHPSKRLVYKAVR